MALCRILLTAALALVCSLVPPAAMAQAKRDIAISRQPGIFYIPTHVIEKQKLIEKHAARLGLSSVNVKWLYFSNGGAQQDALISGGVDIVNSATGQLLLLWDRTRGGVKGIVATAHQPLLFMTRDDRIKSLKDIGPGDKIAVPTVRISSQSILLQMVAVQLFGADKWGYFDPFTIQMGHPDALAAMSNPTHEVRNHFAAPPFHRYELKQTPGARVVISSSDIVGGPLTQSQFFAMTKFTDANPVIVQALRAAAEEAKAFIESQTADAVAIYKEVAGDKTSDADLLDLLSQPEMMQWELYPQGTMKYANHLHAIGSLKTKPASWKDYYLPIAHDLPGN